MLGWLAAGAPLPVPDPVPVDAPLGGVAAALLPAAAPLPVVVGSGTAVSPPAEGFCARLDAGVAAAPVSACATTCEAALLRPTE